jgi:hypothetical protein
MSMTLILNFPVSCSLHNFLVFRTTACDLGVSPAMYIVSRYSAPLRSLARLFIAERHIASLRRDPYRYLLKFRMSVSEPGCETVSKPAQTYRREDTLVQPQRAYIDIDIDIDLLQIVQFTVEMFGSLHHFPILGGMAFPETAHQLFGCT